MRREWDGEANEIENDPRETREIERLYDPRSSPPSAWAAETFRRAAGRSFAAIQAEEKNKITIFWANNLRFNKLSYHCKRKFCLI